MKDPKKELKKARSRFAQEDKKKKTSKTAWGCLTLIIIIFVLIFPYILGFE